MQERPSNGEGGEGGRMIPRRGYLRRLKINQGKRRKGVRVCAAGALVRTGMLLHSTLTLRAAQTSCRCIGDKSGGNFDMVSLQSFDGWYILSIDTSIRQSPASTPCQ